MFSPKLDKRSYLTFLGLYGSLPLCYSELLLDINDEGLVEFMKIFEREMEKSFKELSKRFFLLPYIKLNKKERKIKCVIITNSSLVGKDYLGEIVVGSYKIILN